jgi:D-hexose-6-phosphate mutarotase
MKKSTTITYNIETCDGVSMSELEYKDYEKNSKGEENLLHYKVKKVNNMADDIYNNVSSSIALSNPTNCLTK